MKIEINTVTKTIIVENATIEEIMDFVGNKYKDYKISSKKIKSESMFSTMLPKPWYQYEQKVLPSFGINHVNFNSNE